MKKLLSIIVLGLLLSGNGYAKDLKCELGIQLLKPKSENKVVIDFRKVVIISNSDKI